MCCFERPNLGFLRFKLGARRGQLVFEKGSCALRELLLRLKILIDEKGSEFAVYLLR